MALPEARPRRLIVNADDMGRSSSINQAILQAHRDGILTSASLMVNEPGCDEAVAIARSAPTLGVGLHLTLADGRSALPASQIPGLVDHQDQFSKNPALAGLRYFFQPWLRPQLEAEIIEQFDRFQRTGLPLDHVNGHLNIHLHPIVLGIVLRQTKTRNVRHIRLTSDPFWLNARLASGHWPYRVSHGLIYHALSASARPTLRRRKVGHTDRVFGLLQSGRVDYDYVCRLLAELPEGDSELYSHPSLHDSRHELDALVNPDVRALVQRLRIELSRYQDL
ncbi:MAG: hopanoid biosynthesis-associated protein HpnK [Opitutaceae bacterium]|nr:hopanoid biosynthesis-associated protein HpnK [Verrucomicrobiales bacterium]